MMLSWDMVVTLRVLEGSGLTVGVDKSFVVFQFVLRLKDLLPVNYNWVC